MGYFFETSPMEKHIIYSMDKHILLRRIQSDFISRSIYLAHDFKSTLTAVKFDGNIYFAYITTEDTIDLRHVSTSDYILRIKPDEKHRIDDAKLTFFNNNLIVVFSSKETESGMWALDCVVLNDSMYGNTLTINDTSNEAFRTITKGLTNRPKFSLLNTDKHLLINVKNGEKYQLLELKRDLSVFSHDEMKNSIEQQNHLYLDKINKLQEDVNQLQQANLLLMNKISEFSEDNKKLMADLENTKKALTIREAQIESAKKQYNELMDVASKYRDEAIKWRMKLTNR